MTVRTRPPFRADHVGSLLRPEKLKAARLRYLGAHASDSALGPHDSAELRAVEDECVREVVAMQERVGLRSVTDGEFRRRSWWLDLIMNWEGFTADRTGTMEFTWRNAKGDRMPFSRLWVNGKIADLLGLTGRSVLLPKSNTLCKIATYVPSTHLDAVREALFQSGAGQVGNYTECSFSVQGEGTFTGGEGTTPFLDTPGLRHRENEFKIEVILPVERSSAVIRALREAHPYEEVAYDLIPLANEHQGIGSGLIGTLPQPLEESDFLKVLKQVFGCGVVRHTHLTGKKISKVALCGGAGSFLITSALSAAADAFVTADLKYHEFFQPDGRLLLCDIGHYESEQFTISLLNELLRQKFPTFAILKTETNTNPLHYYS